MTRFWPPNATDVFREKILFWLNLLVEDGFTCTKLEARFGGKSLLIELTCRGKCESGLQLQGPAQAQILPIPTKMLLTLNAEN